MEVIIHFVFEILKIAVLSSLYAVLLLLLFMFLERKFRSDSFAKFLKDKFRFWMISAFIISIILFVFMFSYWGNHGLGDSARIPVGYGKEVTETNGTNAYINPDGYEFGDLPIKKFIKKDYFLVGETDESPVDKPLPYFSWNLKNGKFKLFSDKTEFDKYLIQNQLPEQNEFRTFYENYSNYWNGWRFWLLP